MPEEKSLLRSINQNRWKVFVFISTFSFTLMMMALSLYCAWFEREEEPFIELDEYDLVEREENRKDK